MAKKRSIIYVCEECGVVYTKWVGRCLECEGAVFTETTKGTMSQGTTSQGGGGRSLTGAVEFSSLGSTDNDIEERIVSGIGEFDGVLGGGLVAGGVLLLGGEPGIGKSTLALQVAVGTTKVAERVLYISGEETVGQLRLRGSRLDFLGGDINRVQVAQGHRLEDILETLSIGVNLLVLDSIQTIYTEELGGIAGTVSQIRECAGRLVVAAKECNAALLLIGHVTKEGVIAGPKVLEHMVDVVLQLEGERHHPFRILRSKKNRYGSSEEIGVFDLQREGFIEVKNPSELFLTCIGEGGSIGVVVFAAIEGTRPILVEVQSLTCVSGYSYSKREVIGWHEDRLSMILAVLESKGGYVFSTSDIYLNLGGGLKIGETALDLAASFAVISSLSGQAIPSDLVIFGEISLTGYIKAVSYMELRLKEIMKLGFKKVIMPSGSGLDVGGKLEIIEISWVHEIPEILERIGGK